MRKRNDVVLAISGIVFVLGLGAVVLAATGGPEERGLAATAADELPLVVVYKNPQCSCCQGWVEHMEEAGFEVKVENVTDLRPIKVKYRIPSNLETCHTAVVGDYVVEGHVPAEAVKRMLREQPDVAGIGVPGMPTGSPGMDQGSPANFGRYQVLAFESDGGTAVYEKY